MEIPIELPTRSIQGGSRIGFMVIESDVTNHTDDLKNSLPNILVGRGPQSFAYCFLARPERPGQGAIDNHSAPSQVGALEESTFDQGNPQGDKEVSLLKARSFVGNLDRSIVSLGRVLPPVADCSDADGLDSRQACVNITQSIDECSVCLFLTWGRNGRRNGDRHQ